jgi:hypothetical protein
MTEMSFTTALVKIFLWVSIIHTYTTIWIYIYILYICIYTMAWYLLWHSQTTWELYLASVLLPAHAPQNIHTKWPSSCWPLSSQCTTLSWTDGEKGSESVLRSWHRAMVIRKTNNTLAGGFVFVVDWYGCIYIFIYYFLKIFEAVTYSHNLTTHTYVYIYINTMWNNHFISLRFGSSSQI